NSRERFAAETSAIEQAKADQKTRDHIDKNIRGVPTEAEIIAKDRADEAQRQELMQQAAEDFRLRQDAQRAAVHAQQTQAFQSAEQQAQAQGVAVLQAMVTEFPEVRGLAPNQIPGAVAALEARDPARARALVGRLKQFAGAVGQVHQVRAARE